MNHRSLLRQSLFIAGILGPMMLPFAGISTTQFQSLLIVVVSIPIWWCGLRFILSPARRLGGAISVGFAFGLLFAGPAINEFFQFSVSVAQDSLTWHQSPLWIFGGVGRMYQSSFGGSEELANLGAWLKLYLSCVAFVGFPEELLKILPLLVLLKLRHLRTIRDVWCVAAFSAFGFGVSESVWYLSQTQLEPRDLSSVLSRAVGCPLIHVGMTLGAAWVMVRISSRQTRGGVSLHKVVRTCMTGVVVMAVVHGTYDFLLLTDFVGAAGMLATSTALLIVSTEIFTRDRVRTHSVPGAVEASM